MNLIFFFLSCSPPISKTYSRPSLVLITLDTTRRDHIGVYGKKGAATENIDQIAQEGIRFDQAYSTVPLTTPAHASILTGLYPPKHGIRNNGDAILPNEATTIAEVLQKRGYDTAASVSAFVTTRIWQLDQGFGTYFDTLGSEEQRWAQERSAEKVTDDLVSWLKEAHEDPFFVWAHYYDPHHPHSAPKEYLDQFETAYEAEIAYMDDQIGRLKEAAEETAGEGGVAFIILADHGESFGEHGERGHGLYLWNTTMNIPFVIRGPKPLEEGKSIEKYVVSGVDVFPTALSLLGITPTQSDGRDLSPLLQNKPIEDRPVYLESILSQQRFGYHPEIATVHQGWKLMDTPSAQLFHLNTDTEEAQNIFSEDHLQTSSLRNFAQTTWNSTGLTSENQQSTGVQAQLAALGYMSNDFATTSDIDIKDRQETVQRIESLRKRRPTDPNPESMIPEYLQLIEQEPQLSEVRMGLGGLYAKLNRKEDALAVYQQALLLEPNSNMIKMNMANTLGALKRFDEGLGILEDALAKVPTDISLQSTYLKMLMDTHQIEKAIQKGEEWVEQFPNADLNALLGIALYRNKQINEAVPFLKKSMADGIPREFVYETMGNAFRLRGNTQGAIMFFQKEHDVFPNPLLLAKIGALYAKSKQWKESEEAYSKYFEHFPKQLKHRHTYAQVLFNLKDFKTSEQILAPLMARSEPTPRVLLLQANILAKTERMEEGRTLFERAKSITLPQSKTP
jgi:arylsulfatase A-like enzyme/tetratricopeptide (TPR) repeat protein